MSLGLSQGARKSERVTALMYESLRVFLCIRCVAMDHCARVCVFVYLKKKCLAAFAEEKDSVLKLHQHRGINQSSAVINNRVIRSLFSR